MLKKEIDIKEIAKEMTKSEFLNSDYIKNKSEFRYCPGVYNLENCINIKCDPQINCKECWENAIKDIKFKGEDSMEFDWNEFKKGKIVVHCDTKEKAINFISKCNSQNIKWADKENIIPTKCRFENNKNKTDISYRFMDYGLAIGDLDYYNKYTQYKIVEWKIENPKKDKEYSIQDILTMQEELEFIGSNRLPYKIKNGYLYVYFIKEDKWETSGNSIQEILNMTFTLRYKEKKVTFEEAIQTYGKDIYCIWIDAADTKHKSEYKIYSNESILKDQNEDPIAPVEIFEGEWYIKED
ncbi:hypothetical protein EXN54_20285 [Clostridium botulinum]|nr:hypothetical protein [Clostridium botulinum]NFA07664.1 hypothetical protein [Clostridium botulinum]NFB81026.1 hypothetical protein [Clostridium botulinum]NFB88888.1 hypothetical protein [Clostridium botulinum]NFE25289.1 hypothetical protein [Clostridium botulinum]